MTTEGQAPAGRWRRRNGDGPGSGSGRHAATRLIITKGEKKGQHPSPATALRMLREHDRQSAAASLPTDRSEATSKERIMRISVRRSTVIAAVAVALAGGVTTAATIAAPARPATAPPAAAATDRPDARPQLPAATDLGTVDVRGKRNAVGAVRPVGAVGPLGAATLNRDYQILDAVPGQASGKAGVAVTWLTPTGRDPYKEWDWIGIYKGDMPGYWSYGKYVDWNWACPQAHCHDHGATVINTKLDTGQKYTIVYFTWKWTAVASFTYYRH